jgi:transcriptional antiterminator RfaH
VNNCNRSWYVIISKSGKIKRLSSCLYELGIENLVPMQKQVRQWSDRQKTIEVPIFFNYAFVHCTEKEKRNVFKTEIVKCFLNIGGLPAKVSDKEIMHIRQLVEFEDDISIEKSSVEFVKGQIVKICRGSLKGLSGTVSNNYKSGRKKVGIYIDSLRCFACVELPAKYLTPVQDIVSVD